jgi:hypothetical protein
MRQATPYQAHSGRHADNAPDSGLVSTAVNALFCQKSPEILMHARRPKTLTGVTSLRLTPAEETKVTEAAAERGLTKSQWLRQTILRAVKGSEDTRLVLAELLASRAVLLRLLAEISQGNPVTDPVIRKLLEEANLHKYAMADRCILGREQ